MMHQTFVSQNLKLKLPVSLAHSVAEIVQEDEEQWLEVLEDML